MSVATVKLLVAGNMFKFYFANDPADMARECLARGLYKIHGTMGVDGQGEAAAEEVFDLTNNPSRQEEREGIYGRGRSVSVGDIVNVDGVDYVCAPEGWHQLA